MAEKGMIFCADMVRALLEKRKYSTMRVIKPQPLGSPDEIKQYGTDGKFRARYGSQISSGKGYEWKPKYQVGDRIYVKEGYQIFDVRAKIADGRYMCDNTSFEIQLKKKKWDLWRHRVYPRRITSGRFMYKSLARIFFTITEIDVIRPQDLAKEEYQLEGWPSHREPFPTINAGDKAKNWFRCLWSTLHGDGAWDKNEWCFRYKWKEIEIDGY